MLLFPTNIPTSVCPSGQATNVPNCVSDVLVHTLVIYLKPGAAMPAGSVHVVHDVAPAAEYVPAPHVAHVPADPTVWVRISGPFISGEALRKEVPALCPERYLPASQDVNAVKDVSAVGVHLADKYFPEGMETVHCVHTGAPFASVLDL